MMAKVSDHFFVILGLILESQITHFFCFVRLKKQQIFEQHFSCFFVFLECFRGWFFEPLDVQKWAFRVDETSIFTKLTFPNHTPKTSHLREAKIPIVWSILDQFWEPFFSKNATKN